MGFQESWVTLIIECISTVSYSILINGKPKDLIHLTKGLRHGDPISLYLFLLYAEGLNAIIISTASHGEIQGFSNCRNGPTYSSLFCR